MHSSMWNVRNSGCIRQCGTCKTKCNGIKLEMLPAELAVKCTFDMPGFSLLYLWFPAWIRCAVLCPTDPAVLRCAPACAPPPILQSWCWPPVCAPCLAPRICPLQPPSPGWRSWTSASSHHCARWVDPGWDCAAVHPHAYYDIIDYHCRVYVMCRVWVNECALCQYRCCHESMIVGM